MQDFRGCSVTAAPTDFNAAAASLTEDLRLAVAAFDKEHADFAPMIACATRMAQLRGAFWDKLASPGLHDESIAALRRMPGIMDEVSEGTRLFGEQPYDPEAHRTMQESFGKGIDGLARIAAQLAQGAGDCTRIGLECGAMGGAGRAFKEAAQHVLDAYVMDKMADLPPALERLFDDLTAATTDIGRLAAAKQAEADKSGHFLGLAQSAGDNIKKLTDMKETSAAYVDNLEKGISQFSDGVADEMPVSKPLAFAKRGVVP
jgi:hypothetical protein